MDGKLLLKLKKTEYYSVGLVHVYVAQYDHCWDVRNSLNKNRVYSWETSVCSSKILSRWII